jgi:Spy/CpxP family protein refolding chaperone
MRKSIAIAVAVVTVVGLTGMLATACKPHGHRHFNPEKVNKFVTWHINDVLDDLDANEEQRTAILTVKDQVLADIRELKETMPRDRQAVMEELTKGEPDAEKLHTLLDAKIDRLRSFAHKELDNLLAVHGTLTPEQRAELIAKAKERHRGW